MGGIEGWRLALYVLVSLVANTAIFWVFGRHVAKNVAFLIRCEHELTRHHVDRVLECVEPEPVPEKPPIGFRQGA